MVDLTGGVRITRRLRADVQVNNATDENYYEKRGYGPPQAWHEILPDL